MGILQIARYQCWATKEKDKFLKRHKPPQFIPEKNRKSEYTYKMQKKKKLLAIKSFCTKEFLDSFYW